MESGLTAQDCYNESKLNNSCFPGEKYIYFKTEGACYCCDEANPLDNIEDDDDYDIYLGEAGPNKSCVDITC